MLLTGRNLLTVPFDIFIGRQLLLALWSGLPLIFVHWKNYFIVEREKETLNEDFLSVILFLFTAFQSANAGGIPGALAGILSTLNQEIQGKLFVFSMAIQSKFYRTKSPSGFAWQTSMHRRKNRLSGAGQQISLKLCLQHSLLR